MSKITKLDYNQARTEIIASNPLNSHKINLLFDFVTYLNSVLQIDQMAISKLLDFAIPCSSELIDHPTVIIREENSEAKLSVLGLLGGFFNLDAYRLVAQFDDTEKITEFFVGKMED